MVYIVYGISNRYKTQVEPAKKRDFKIKELGILSIHLGIVFITIGSVFATMFTTEFTASASISEKGTVNPVSNTPYGLSVVEFQTLVDYGLEGEKPEPAPPGITISEFYASLEAGQVSESYTLRGVIVDIMQTEHITYVKMSEGGRELWVAIDRIENVPTDINVVADGMLMANFPSPTLNRTFDLILFSNRMAEYTPGTGKEPYTTTEEVTFAVYESGKKIGEGVARSIRYRNGNANRVMIDRGFFGDVYVIYNGLSGNSASATVKIIPMVNQLWFGVALFMLGVALAFFFDPLYKASK